MLAATLRITRDFDAAEECVQDAFARALATWGENGIPANPGAWLTTVARRRAIDLGRRRDVAARSRHLLVVDSSDDSAPTDSDFEDDRLRLIFTCCHPSLNLDTQVALSLRMLCGLSTVEVAKAFLVKESAMAARITRAKKKIALARIPYRIPDRTELRDRVDAVLLVVHLLFTTGHTAPVGDDLSQGDLVERSLDLARMLRALLPEDAEVASLLALILLTDSRRSTRVGPDGAFLALADQDRSKWHHDAIDEGLVLVGESVRRGRPGRFTLMSAIAAVHSSAAQWDETDWTEIVGLYDLLLEAWPSPVVALNRAVAVSFAEGPLAGLAAIELLSTDPQLSTYPYLAAARGNCLERLGRTAEARDAFEEAAILTENTVERDFMRARAAYLA
ncbi:MAG: sigma-70 family RNA polymerase sigma factor [Acidimicrobiales bacterium]